MKNLPRAASRTAAGLLAVAAAAVAIVSAAQDDRRPPRPIRPPAAGSSSPRSGAAGVSLPPRPFPSYRFLRPLNPLTDALLPDMPAYLSHHGSAPTAVAMLMAYHSLHGFPELMPGDVTVQGPLIDDIIASPGHYLDYSLPLDEPPDLLPDKSEGPPEDCHTDDSLADFLCTSRSAFGNFYGDTLSVDIKAGIEKYLKWVGGYRVITTPNRCQNVAWWTIRNEIISGRPMIFLVDPEGRGNADLYVTVAGLRSEGGVSFYGCHTTRDRELRWFELRPVQEGREWGVNTIYTVVITQAVFPPLEASIVRVVNDYFFFREEINRLSWKPNPSNKTPIVRTKILRKPLGSPDSAFAIVAELDASQAQFDDRGLSSSDRFVYRLTSVDESGHESPPATVTN